MLTPQEVSTHAFSKAVMGGYNMAMVDEFLDELTDDYTALYKENAALKAKLKVLVEKVEDYRATEDSMRATLLTAQKMADSIVHEAEAKRDEILAQAETSAREKIGQLRQEVEAAEERLHQGQRDLAQFIAASREICEKELKFLEQLPELRWRRRSRFPSRSRRRPSSRSRKRCWPLSASRAWRRKRPRRKRKRRLRRRRMTIRRGTPLRLILWMSLPAASISTI